MACSICQAVAQFGMNVALIADHALNTFLLGDPNETLSRRIARARAAGQSWAKLVCKVLSFFAFGGDHCTWAEQPGTSGNEIWHWSDNFSQPNLD